MNYLSKLQTEQYINIEQMSTSKRFGWEKNDQKAIDSKTPGI